MTVLYAGYISEKVFVISCYHLAHFGALNKDICLFLKLLLDLLVPFLLSDACFEVVVCLDVFVVVLGDLIDFFLVDRPSLFF